VRWRFLDPAEPGEIAHREATLQAMDRWWAAFAEHAQAIDDHFETKAPFEIVEFMDTHLGPVHEGISGWEFGPGVAKGGHRLVISCEANHELRPLVTTLIERAPDLPRWEFFPYRLPDPRWTYETIAGRVRVDVADLGVKLSRGKFGRIDVVFSCADADRIRPNALEHLAFVAAETLFGEEALDHWVGVVEGKADDLEDYLPFAEIPAAFEALRDELRAELPAEPCHVWAEGAEHSLISLEPPEAPDYVDQDDSISVVSMLPVMWETAWRGAPFASERFSRCGETFAYLKLEFPHEDANERLSARHEIQEALGAILEPTRVGTVVGAALGRRYAYVHLALSDVEAAWGLMKPILVGHDMPRRTWLLFCDHDLRGEWLGPWPDTPEPPRASRD
jgi:hypothetical protein